MCMLTYMLIVDIQRQDGRGLEPVESAPFKGPLHPGETPSIRRPNFQKDRFERYIAWCAKYLKRRASTS